MGAVDNVLILMLMFIVDHADAKTFEGDCLKATHVGNSRLNYVAAVVTR
jgi:hypothetical protein